MNNKLFNAAFHTSSLPQYSMISVHKLLQAIVPRFCWLLLRLHESLYSMNGVPVSICAPVMWSHSFLAAITRRPRPSLSYLHYHQQWLQFTAFTEYIQYNSIEFTNNIYWKKSVPCQGTGASHSTLKYAMAWPFQCNIFLTELLQIYGVHHALLTL